MDLEFALLGLICLHQGVTGYELNRIIKESTGYMLSASLSHIYPTLRKLHDRGLVSCSGIPMKNRPDKKVYLITATGDAAFKAWLEAPIKSSLDFKAFCLKMAFSPLMSREIILAHIDREVAYRQEMSHHREPGIQVEVDYLDKEKFNRPRAELLWEGLYRVQLQTEALRIAWLTEWRKQVEVNLED